jgi:hypothetical protein
MVSNLKAGTANKYITVQVQVQVVDIIPNMPTSTLGHGGTYKPVLAIIYGEGILT